MKYLLGIDLGTSGIKVILCNTAGEIVKEYSKEYDIIQPHNGWAEQDPNVWREAFYSILDQIKEEINIKDIVSIGASGQMHGLVLLDENNKVLRNAIIWCDQRTINECDEIKSKIGFSLIKSLTCNDMLPGFTLPKLIWVRNHEEAIYCKVRHILLPKDYLTFLLSGLYTTDVTDASGTGIFNVIERKWSYEIIDGLDVDRSILPTVYESSDIVGRVSKEAQERFGFSEDCIVIAGAGDNAGAAIGNGVCKDGDGFVTIGTSGVTFLQSSTPKFDEKLRIHTFCSAVRGTWHLMGVHQASGLSMSWFKNNLGLKYQEAAKANGSEVYNEVVDGAMKSTIGANKLIYLPYLMGERSPHLDGYARGVFFGLNASHTLDDMARSVIEGISYSLRDSVEIFRALNLLPRELVMCGGGAKNPKWVQMITDVLKVNTKRLKTDKGPSLGMCVLGGIAAGVFKDLNEACSKVVQYKDSYKVTSDSDKYNSYYEVYRNLYSHLKDDFKKLNLVGE